MCKSITISSTSKNKKIMIKAEVTVCGTISRIATVRNGKEGQQFVSFGIQTVVKAMSGINKTIDISVAKDYVEGEDTGVIRQGTRIEVKGTLTFRKKGEALYLNMEASDISLENVSGEDSIVGNLHFLGKASKNVEVKTTKKGDSFIVFSGFSTSKEDENFEYIWVRFVHFETERPEWLANKTPIDVKGTLELSVYNDKLEIGCRVNELKPWEKEQQQ